MNWPSFTRRRGYRRQRASSQNGSSPGVTVVSPKPTGGSKLERILARAHLEHHLAGTDEFELVAHPSGEVHLYPYPSTHKVGTTFAVLTQADFERYTTVDSFVAGRLETCGEVGRARITAVERINAGHPDATV